MKIRKAGFYKELRHGDENGESLHDICFHLPQVHEDIIIKYLESGVVLAACGGVVDDVLNPANKAVASPNILTDGVWIWPEDLIYYVRKYHAKLNADFVVHMKDNDWHIKQDSIDLEKMIPM